MGLAATDGYRVLNTGAVFRLPLDDDRVGYGQIVGRTESEGAYYFAIFERAVPRHEHPDLGSVVSGEIALLALSFDALLHHGYWEIVGTEPVLVDRTSGPFIRCQRLRTCFKQSTTNGGASN